MTCTPDGPVLEAGVHGDEQANREAADHDGAAAEESRVESSRIYSYEQARELGLLDRECPSGGV